MSSTKRRSILSSSSSRILLGALSLAAFHTFDAQAAGYLTSPSTSGPVIVTKDVGGLVTEYQAQTDIYRRQNREVKLHECRSACTLALSLPKVCVFPDAKVKFHQAYNQETNEADLDVSARLFASYPRAVQRRLIQLGGG